MILHALHWFIRLYWESWDWRFLLSFLNIFPHDYEIRCKSFEWLNTSILTISVRTIMIPPRSQRLNFWVFYFFLGSFWIVDTHVSAYFLASTLCLKFVLWFDSFHWSYVICWLIHGWHGALCVVSGMSYRLPFYELYMPYSSSEWWNLDYIWVRSLCDPHKFVCWVWAYLDYILLVYL